MDKWMNELMDEWMKTASYALHAVKLPFLGIFKFSSYAFGRGQAKKTEIERQKKAAPSDAALQ
jgi:hypothetical protein